MRIDSFLGIAPAIAPMHLPEAFATEAENCYMDKGTALVPELAPQPILEPLYAVDGSVFSGKPVTLWRSGDVWVAWDHWVHVCHDPREYGSKHAFLYVDNGALFRCSDAWVLDKSGPRQVGVERPTDYAVAEVLDTGMSWSADPGAALECTDGLPTCDGNAAHPGEPRSYMVTVVNSMEEESAPSNPSPVILVPPGKAVAVSIPEQSGAVRYRWYRTLSDGKVGGWQYVTETPGPALLDIYDAAVLGDPLDTATFYPPPAQLKGVARLGHANIVVWTANGHMWPSHSRLPHAFAPAGRVSVPHEIVTLRSTTEMVEERTSTSDAGESYLTYILTTGCPYYGAYVPNRDDGAYLDVHAMALDEPCVAPWAATVGEGACYYASDRGIVRLSGGRASSVLDTQFSKAYWTKFQPGKMKLAYNRGRLFGFWHIGGWVLPISEYLQDRKHILSTTSISADAVYCDAETNLVMALRGNILSRWGQGTAPLRATWKSAEWQMPEYWNPGVIKVDADIHSLRSSSSDRTWALFQDWIKQNGACAGPAFWKAHPELVHDRGFVNYMLNPIIITVFREGRVFSRKEVISERPHRLPRQGKGIYWSVKIETPIPVYRVMLEKGIKDLASSSRGEREG